MFNEMNENKDQYLSEQEYSDAIPENYREDKIQEYQALMKNQGQSADVKNFDELFIP